MAIDERLLEVVATGENMSQMPFVVLGSRSAFPIKDVDLSLVYRGFPFPDLLAEEKLFRSSDPAEFGSMRARQAVLGYLKKCDEIGVAPYTVVRNPIRMSQVQSNKFLPATCCPDLDAISCDQKFLHGLLIAGCDPSIADRHAHQIIILKRSVRGFDVEGINEILNVAANEGYVVVGGEASYAQRMVVSDEEREIEFGKLEFDVARGDDLGITSFKLRFSPNYESVASMGDVDIENTEQQITNWMNRIRHTFDPESSIFAAQRLQGELFPGEMRQERNLIPLSHSEK